MIRTPVTVLSLLLAGSVAMNVLGHFEDKNVDRNAMCAGFKDQAAERIRTYYTAGDVLSVYPDEIFWSAKRGSCVAVWSGYRPDSSSVESKVIFDAITNEDIFSETIYYPSVGTTDYALEAKKAEHAIAQQESFERKLSSLKGRWF